MVGDWTNGPKSAIITSDTVLVRQYLPKKKQKHPPQRRTRRGGGKNKNTIEMNITTAQVELLSLKEASELTPYSADYLNLLARKGKIHARKIGRDWLITKTDLFSYMKHQQVESETRSRQLSRYINQLAN